MATGCTISEIGANLSPNEGRVIINQLIRCFNASGGGGVSINYISDSTIISAITDSSSWADGTFTGSTTGLNPGNIYIDSVNNLKYEYGDSKLIRINFNTQV